MPENTPEELCICSHARDEHADDQFEAESHNRGCTITDCSCPEFEADTERGTISIMSNRFEAMTDADFDHAIGMYQAALARRGAETQVWKRLAFDLIRAAGGTQRISMTTVLAAHTEDVLEAHHDFESGDMVYRVYRSAAL